MVMVVVSILYGLYPIEKQVGRLLFQRPLNVDRRHALSRQVVEPDPVGKQRLAIRAALGRQDGRRGGVADEVDRRVGVACSQVEQGGVRQERIADGAGAQDEDRTGG